MNLKDLFHRLFKPKQWEEKKRMEAYASAMSRVAPRPGSIFSTDEASLVGFRKQPSGLIVPVATKKPFDENEDMPFIAKDSELS